MVRNFMNNTNNLLPISIEKWLDFITLFGPATEGISDFHDHSL